MDVADYKSSHIEVVDIENKSKGVVAQEFIKKGTLLQASKALAATFHNAVDWNKKAFTNTVYLSQNRYNTGNESETLACLVSKMRDDPNVSGQVYALYAGPDHDRSPLAHGLIDIERVEAIYSFNSFQIKNNLELLDLMDMESRVKELDKHLDEVDDLNEVDLSLLSVESDEYKKLQTLQIKYNNLNRQCGLWHFSAYFNHSCISNVSLNTIGSV